MTYKTQPGTIPHRVLTYLKSQPEGAEFTSVQICEAIGCDNDNFAYLMRRAIKGGALKMRMKPGFAKLLFWSLGDGTPLPEPEDHEDDAPLPRKPAPVPRPGPLFLLLSPSLVAFVVILTTHYLIDRYRLARFVVYAKNWTTNPALRWEACKATGYPETAPPWLAFWLLIIADNTLHLCINYAALRWL